MRRYQYTAIDDATRVRALRIYDRHTQANAIAFIDYVIASADSDVGAKRHQRSADRTCNASTEVEAVVSTASGDRVIAQIGRAHV